MADGGLPITSGARERLLDRVLTTLSEKYIFPDVAARIATEIRTRAARGEYAAITDGPAFAQLLTTHLRAAGNDNTSASTAAPSHVRSRPMTAAPGTSSNASSAPAPSPTTASAGSSDSRATSATCGSTSSNRAPVPRPRVPPAPPSPFLAG